MSERRGVSAIPWVVVTKGSREGGEGDVSWICERDGAPSPVRGWPRTNFGYLLRDGEDVRVKRAEHSLACQ